MAGKKSSRGPTQKPIEMHGMSKTREYRAWADMITRCTNPKFIKYQYYGGKGVRVCDEWRKSFVAFYRHMGKCPPKHTLDRIESDKGYDPGNCRWVTMAVQARNKSRVRLLKFNGQTKHLTDWANELGFNFLVIWKRLDRGWSVEKALTTPLRKY